MESEETDCGCMSRAKNSNGQRKSTLIISPTDVVRRSIEIRSGPLIFEGKRVLVTGASRGLGRSLAKSMYHLGAHVIAVGKTDADLETLSTEIPELQLIELDITKWSLTERKLSNIGDVDLLVNCAGVSNFNSILNISEEEFDSMFNVNAKASINIIKIVAQMLIKRKAKGSLVTISSQSCTYGIKKHGLFGASKAAIEAFTRTAALEFAPHGIRVNCVSPAVVLTKSARQTWDKTKESKPMLQRIPMKRFGEIREVVQAVLFLLSDKSSMITGYCLPVDGGFAAC